MLHDPAVITQIIGFGSFTWLGLYLLVRAPRHAPLIVMSSIALFAQAAFFGYNAIADTSTSRSLFVGLERWFWWSTILPLAIWFHFSSLLVRQTRQRHAGANPSELPLPVLAVYSWAGAMILVGSTSSLFVDYSSVVQQADGTFYMFAGPAYPVYIVYNGTVTLGALVNFLRVGSELQREGAGRRALAQQLYVLAAGAFLFLVGALWLPIRYYGMLDISVVPGNLALFIGLVVIGYGVTHFGMLLEGQNIQRDFIYNLTSIALLNLVYTGLLLSAGGEPAPVVLAFVFLVTLTHTTFDNGRAVLDRFFFSRAERTARAEAREYASALGTNPVSPPIFAQDAGGEQSDEQQDEALEEEDRISSQDDMPGAEPPPRVPKAFKDNVRRAVTNLKSPPQLAKSPLLSLSLVEQRLVQAEREDNRLNRATTLRELLIEQIEALQPNDTASSHTGDAWRFYNVLYYPYVREISRKGALSEARRLAELRRRAGRREQSAQEEVLAWLADIDENTFYKWQRRASDTIATILWEENHKAEQGTAAMAHEAA
jgi:hypothetical protein